VSTNVSDMYAYVITILARNQFVSWHTYRGPKGRVLHRKGAFRSSSRASANCAVLGFSSPHVQHQALNKSNAINFKRDITFG
jgi:hypothetical protein